MTNLKNLSDSELLSQTKIAASDERNQTFKVLHYLREVERRGLFLERSHTSMFVFCMKELGYDEHQTQRRLAAMRLLREVPEIEPKIASGELSLTVLNKAKTAFNKMAKKSVKLSSNQKLEILKTLENKSIRESERELIKVCPEVLPKKSESQRPLTDELIELKLVVKKESLEKLKRLKDFLSHKKMTTAELFDFVIDLGLREADPARKKREIKNASKQSPAQVQNETEKLKDTEVLVEKTQGEKEQKEKVQGGEYQREKPQSDLTQRKTKSRYIPKPIRRKVWQRDQGKCKFTDPTTGMQCDSTFQIQIEHIKPFSLGGEHELDNLTLYCRAHNIHQAVKVFGAKKMAEFGVGR